MPVGWPTGGPPSQYRHCLQQMLHGRTSTFFLLSWLVPSVASLDVTQKDVRDEDIEAFYVVLDTQVRRPIVHEAASRVVTLGEKAGRVGATPVSDNVLARLPDGFVLQHAKGVLQAFPLVGWESGPSTCRMNVSSNACASAGRSPCPARGHSTAVMRLKKRARTEFSKREEL
jgi:hypothetical protein